MPKRETEIKMAAIGQEKYHTGGRAMGRQRKMKRLACQVTHLSGNVLGGRRRQRRDTI
jgi:hypothetical protein